MTGGPWRLPPADDQGPTYLAHVLALTARHGPGQPLHQGGYPLPDSEPSRRRPLMSEAVLDGIRTHHTRVAPDEPAAATLSRILGALVAEPPTAAALGHLHDVAAGVDLLRTADELTVADLPVERLRQLGRWLAEHGTRRNTVALGIVLLGLAGDHRDRELLLLLGSLEALSLYAAVALDRSQPDRDRALFDLARRVDGWGRIHAVRRLAGTEDPQIKAWLLRHGYRNRIMDEYLAHTAATTGDLHAALTTPPVDDELLDGAGGILTALCRGGPTADITDYPEAPQAIDRYLTLVAQRAPGLGRIVVVLELARFLGSGRATGPNWVATTRSRLSRTCGRLLGQADWLRVVDEALDSPDLSRFRAGIWPAKRLGIPTRARVRARVHTHPDDAYLWQALTDDIDDVLALAHQLLPLDTLANGPGLDHGLGTGRPEHILDVIVSHLDNHPGKGWPLIRIALANSTIRNRNMAVRALAAWPPDTIPAHVIAALEQAIMIEPNPSVRDRMRHLLDTCLQTQMDRTASQLDLDRSTNSVGSRQVSTSSFEERSGE